MMVRRVELAPAPEPAVTGTTIDAAIERRLSLLGRLLHLPDGVRTAVCDEIDAHLRQCIRDLVLAGHDEDAAVSKALAELGETAELARRLEHAHRTPRRRLLMNLTLLGTGAAVMASAAFLVSTPGARPGHAVFQAETTATPAAFVEATCTIPAGATLLEALAMVDEAVDPPVLVLWTALAYEGLDVEDAALLRMPVELKSVPLAEATAFIARVAGEITPCAWRYGDRFIEFGPRDVFDRREIVLVSYDLSACLEAVVLDTDVEIAAARERVASLLYALVEPDHWEANGGDLARLQVAGNRLFVHAPPRFQTRVAWILDELARTGQAAARSTMDEAMAALSARRVDLVKALRAERARVPSDSARRRAIEAELRTVERSLAPRLAVGDRLTVDIYELRAADTWHRITRRLDASGVFRLQEIEPVAAAGLTREEFAETLTEALSTLLVEPRIEVYVGDETASPYALKD